MRYLPVSIDTKDKVILIVGGGKVAYRKVQKLLNTEFKIYVIALKFDENLFALSQTHPNKISIKQQKINESFVFFGYDYLIIATNDFKINAALEARAQRTKVPYLRCDTQNESTFIMSKLLTNGDIAVSISLDGKNPTITEIIGEDLEKIVSEYDPEKIRVLNDIRTELVRSHAPDIDETIRDLFFKETITLNKYLKDMDNKTTSKLLDTEMEKSEVVDEETISVDISDEKEDITEEITIEEIVEANTEDEKDN